MTILGRAVEILFFSSEGLILLLLVTGLLASLSKRRNRLGHRLMTIGATLYVVVLLTPLSDVLIVTLEHPFPPLLEVPADPNLETIVVLAGAAMYDPGLPVQDNLEGDTVRRVLEGIRLHNQRPQLRLLISGGNRVDTRRASVASVIADVARTFGVAESMIRVEEKSQNTYQNLVEVKRMLGVKRFILVTSAHHLPRAMAVARKLQMDPIAAPTGFSGTSGLYRRSLSRSIWSWDTVKRFGVADPDRFRFFDRALHEFVGYAWYWLRGMA
jgi:uncharacterized SAM-binding protein YcdF (DUF218 family)